MSLVSTAACAHRAMPPLAGPSSAPVLETPARAVVIAAPTEGDWKALGDEAIALLSQYLRINTTNPPGNEIAAARWLAQVLQRDGIEARIFEPAPGKANLYARVRGDGSARPLIFLNHMDVVLASPEYWKVDPFGGVVQDGYVWGRGALDMKGEAIAQLMTLITLKRAGVPLKRDVIFLATSDEEVGAGVGAGWFVEAHPELVRDAEFLINEGGTIRADVNGRIEYYGVGTTEKSPFWLDVTARGTSGHGSRPTPDNPVHRLVRALSRIANHQTPLIVTPAVERYFRDLPTHRVHGQPLLPPAGDRQLRPVSVPAQRGRVTGCARERRAREPRGPELRRPLHVRRRLARRREVIGPLFYPRPYPPSRTPRPPVWQRRIEAPLGAAVELVLAPFWRWDPGALRLPELTLTVRGLPRAFDGYRIALVTDLHHSRAVPDWWIREVAARSAALAPDLVVLGGDLVSHRRRELDGLAELLARFTARDGVVAVLGNHDHWVGAGAVADAVRAAGADLLENRHRLIERGGGG